MIALPFPVWGSLRLTRGRRLGWKSPIYAGTILGLFLIPLFIYSSDPRYRLPCDILLILDSIIVLYRTRRTSPDHA